MTYLKLSSEPLPSIYFHEPPAVHRLNHTLHMPHRSLPLRRVEARVILHRFPHHRSNPAQSHLTSILFPFAISDLTRSVPFPDRAENLVRELRSPLPSFEHRYSATQQNKTRRRQDQNNAVPSNQRYIYQALDFEKS